MKLSVLEFSRTVKTTGETGGLHQPLKGVITGLTSEEVLKV